MKRIFGIIALVALAPLVLFVLTEPPSASAGAYVVGLAAIAASLAWSNRRIAIAGVALVAIALVVRVTTTKRAGDLRAIDRVIDERDLSVNAARAIAWTHFMKDPDVPLLPDAMRDAYDDMKKEAGDLPSPVVATYLGLERPKASDTIEFGSTGKDAVIFLHGYAGNFTMSCFLFARAAARAHMTTVCPSTRWVGDWWSHDGEAITRDTLASLRERGFRKIFLAGLSNGAIGASRLAPRLGNEIAGVVLVSGAASDAMAPNVPVLVLQGRDDVQLPASIERAYAQRADAKYVELPAGHFVLLVERERSARAIAEWLTTHADTIDDAARSHHARR